MQDLYAFWIYDRFPYFDYGDIVAFDDQGKAQISRSLGWVKPVLILPKGAGQKLANELAELSAERDAEIQGVNNRYLDRLRDKASLLSDLVPATWY
jgi:hypothetical protein